MKKISSLIILTLYLSIPGLTWSHEIVDTGKMDLSEYRKPKVRTILDVPDLNGYVTLKCDFHMHTVFSDGLVWPSIRVQEAWQEGLDSIAITDHLEYSPHKDDVIINHNRPYEIARGAASSSDILLVRGSEITRNTPPGHFNAIFVTDSSVLQTDKEEGNFELDQLAIDRAKEQNAFVFWNHPGWKSSTIEGSYEWIEFVDKQVRDGKLDGIEVINGFTFHRKSLDWALEHDLTVMATTDIHNLVVHDYDMQRGITRSMTLVFARDRSPQGIREALEARRTVAWSTKLLAGSEKWVRSLYDACVTVEKPFMTDNRGYASSNIRNDSDLHFELERIEPKQGSWPDSIILPPKTSTVLKVKAAENAPSARYSVSNAYVGGYENLVVEVQLPQ